MAEHIIQLNRVFLVSFSQTAITSEPAIRWGLSSKNSCQWFNRTAIHGRLQRPMALTLPATREHTNAWSAEVGCSRYDVYQWTRRRAALCSRFRIWLWIFSIVVLQVSWTHEIIARLLHCFDFYDLYLWLKK